MTRKTERKIIEYRKTDNKFIYEPFSIGLNVQKYNIISIMV